LYPETRALGRGGLDVLPAPIEALIALSDQLFAVAWPDGIPARRRAPMQLRPRGARA